MKLDPIHIEYIRDSFSKLESKKDLLGLLNYVKPLVYGPDTKLFELRQVSWYVLTEHRTKHYNQFTLQKKSGGIRVIHAPVKGLKVIQTCLSQILQTVFTPHQSSFGFAQGKSIVGNAKKHISSNYVFNIDLKNFFPSIDQARFWKCLQLPPFNLCDRVYLEIKDEVRDGLELFLSDNDKRQGIFTAYYKNLFLDKGEFEIIESSNIFFCKVYPSSNLDHFNGKIEIQLNRSIIHGKRGIEIRTIPNEILIEYLNKIFGNWNTNNISIVKRRDIANLLAALCFTPLDVNEDNTIIKNRLPQGAPTSPVITNIICQRLDFLLSGAAKRFGLVYSRYADDITFSSSHNVYNQDSDFLKELRRIIQDQGFQINENKTRLQKVGARQEVTGLVVSKIVNVRKEYIKEIRAWLYFLERYGYEKANNIFLDNYPKSVNKLNKNAPPLLSALKGKIDFLRMVKGRESIICINLENRLKKIEGVNSDIVGDRTNYRLDKTLDLIFRKGIDEAMQFYKHIPK